MRTIIKGSEGDKMENILNYVRLRQDISFQMSPFNVIDALILSDLAYVDWNNIVKDEKLIFNERVRNILRCILQKKYSENMYFQIMFLTWLKKFLVQIVLKTSP